MGIRIDALDAATSVADNHAFPAMKDGATVKVTAAQILSKVSDDLSDHFALKAPLDSPSFTGNPTAPTPSAGDSDTSIATTAFVQNALAINSLTEKITPVDQDQVRIADSEASFAAKKLTFSNLWTWCRGKILNLFNVSGGAPVYACRAWVNFNGTGTVSIRSSGNVSSITDNGAGDYTVNFAVPMPDANYAPVLTCGNAGGTSYRSALLNLAAGRPNSASACSLQVVNSSFAASDDNNISVAIFR